MRCAILLLASFIPLACGRSDLATTARSGNSSSTAKVTMNPCNGCYYWDPSKEHCEPICTGKCERPEVGTCYCAQPTCKNGEELAEDCQCKDRCTSELRTCSDLASCVAAKSPAECETARRQSETKGCWDKTVKCSTEIAPPPPQCPGCTFWSDTSKSCTPIQCSGRCETPDFSRGCACVPPPPCASGQELRDDCRCHDRCEGAMRNCAEFEGCMRETSGNGNACNGRKNASQARGCWHDAPGC